MLQTTSQKVLVAVVILVVLALFGYFAFSGPVETVAPADLSGQEVLGGDILILASQIENISIDQSVFNSPIFLSLVDYEIPLSAELQGRVNPFAAIGAENPVISANPKANTKLPQ